MHFWLYPKKMKTLFWKDTCTPTFIGTLFIVVKIWKQHKCPLAENGCTDTHTHTHTHDGIIFSHYKEWPFTIYNNMDGPGGCYA